MYFSAKAQPMTKVTYKWFQNQIDLEMKQLDSMKTDCKKCRTEIQTSEYWLNMPFGNDMKII